MCGQAGARLEGAGHERCCGRAAAARQRRACLTPGLALLPRCTAAQLVRSRSHGDVGALVGLARDSLVCEQRRAVGVVAAVHRRHERRLAQRQAQRGGRRDSRSCQQSQRDQPHGGSGRQRGRGTGEGFVRLCSGRSQSQRQQQRYRQLIGEVGVTVGPAGLHCSGMPAAALALAARSLFSLMAAIAAS